MSLYSYAYQKSQLPSVSNDHLIRRILIRSVIALSSLLLFLLSSLLLNNFNSYFASPISASTPNEVPNEARSAKWDEVGPNTPSPSPTPGSNLYDAAVIVSVTPSPTPYTLIPSPYPLTPAKSLYTIAIIGDSMVDTMGEVLEYLDSALKKKYPQTKFLLYNYGTGAQNIEMGLARFGSHFKYQSRNYQSLPELKPDILIVASFSYNPFTPHDRDRHWLTLTKLVESARSVSSNVYMLAEIAPLRKDFGKGPQGVNWSDDTNYEHSGRIVEQLQNAVGLSKSLQIPLIDAFSPSFNSSTQEGNRSYVNPSDGIHPSVEGHQFMAEKIAQTIRLP